MSADPGADGLPDPEVETAVDALNDALEGPVRGQSVQDWLEEVQAAHTAVYGSSPEYAEPPFSNWPEQVIDDSEPISTADLCQSPLGIWTDSASTERVADAIADPAVYTELIENLQDFLGGWLYHDLSSPAVQTGWLTTKVTKLSCNPDSSFQVSVPISLGGAINIGEINFKAVNASYRELGDATGSYYELCFDLENYDIDGFTLGWPVTSFLRDYIDNGLGQGLFCHQTWWGD